MDGPLQLTRVVRKATVGFEVIDSQGDSASVEVECLSPELTPRSLVGILCNDLLVLCRDPSEGQDPTSSVDLWAVLRMQTLPQPASIVHGNSECTSPRSLVDELFTWRTWMQLFAWSTTRPFFTLTLPPRLTP